MPMDLNTDLYLISNGSMGTFPENKRSRYINRLSKPLSVQDNSLSYLYIALESVTIENSFIQYPSEEEYPDIICFNKSMEDDPDHFIIPKNFFESTSKLIDCLKTNCLIDFLKDIRLTNNKFTLQTNGKYTFFSVQLFTFLGFDKTAKLRILGQDWLDGRFKHFYGKYYVVESGHIVRFHAVRAFDLNYKSPSLIKVRSSNIKQYLSGGGYSNVLAVFPIDFANRTTFFTQKIKEYFLLNTEFLSDITIELIDENNHLIPIISGPPSILRVVIKEMTHVKDSFHIQVSSNDSNDTFLNNTTSRFKVKLPKRLDLSGNWSLALTRIYLPSKLKNLIPPFNYIKIKTILQPKNKEKHTVNEDTVITLPCTWCSSISELINILNLSLEKTPLQFKFFRDRVSIISRTRKNTLSHEIRIHIKLAGLLGFEKNTTSSNELNNETVIRLPSYKRKEGKPNNRYTFPLLPDLEYAIPPYAFLYCSMVSKTVIGSTPVSLLKIVPIQFPRLSQVKGILHEFEHLEYFSVQSTSVQTIEFELRSHDGHLLIFEDGNVLLTLTFKKNLQK